MDRRNFIKTASLFGAGSTIASSLIGCQAYTEILLPHLAVVEPPAPVAGMTYIWASKIGCALDCDLGTGRNKHTGHTATDDAPRINAAMAGASADNPLTLIIDGSALISGLFLPAGGYWSIAGLGGDSGFFIKSGSNSDGIVNASLSAPALWQPGPPAPPRGQNVSLSNFTLNGNRSGDSTSRLLLGTSTTWFCGINLVNLNNISIENIVTVNTPAFNFRFNNVGNVSVSGCIMMGNEPGSDGLHFDGPANDIAISNCQFSTGDDSIALNCPEGYTGNISRVSVKDCTFNSWSLMRLDTIQSYGAPDKFYIDSVSVSNCKGTLVNGGFLLGAGFGSNLDSVRDLTISDCSLTAPTILEVGVSFGQITLTNVTFTPSGSRQDPGFALMRTSSFFPDGTYVGTQLILNNCTIYRTNDQDVSLLIVVNDSVVKNMTLNALNIKNSKPYPPAQQLLHFPAGTMGQLVINTLDSSNIRTLTTPQGYSMIGSICGVGVLATGWLIPDSVMEDGAPYISASTGKPSIKVNGAVESYTAPS